MPSRRTSAVSSPSREWVSAIASPKRSFSLSRTSLLMGLPVLPLGAFDVGEDPELVVPLAVLDLVLEQHQPVEDLLGARRAAGDVDIDRHHLIGAGHGVVVLVEAARRRADP